MVVWLVIIDAVVASFIILLTGVTTDPFEAVLFFHGGPLDAIALLVVLSTAAAVVSFNFAVVGNVVCRRLKVVLLEVLSSFVFSFFFNVEMTSLSEVAAFTDFCFDVLCCLTFLIFPFTRLTAAEAELLELWLLETL